MLTTQDLGKWLNCLKGDAKMGWAFDEINDYTGFAKGDKFETEQQVREYFTVANIEDMFGECYLAQDELDEMAGVIIANRWHMVEQS